MCNFSKTDQTAGSCKYKKLQGFCFLKVSQLPFFKLLVSDTGWLQKNLSNPKLGVIILNREMQCSHLLITHYILRFCRTHTAFQMVLHDSYFQQAAFSKLHDNILFLEMEKYSICLTSGSVYLTIRLES